ncbi:MAG: hypothetical protein DRP42_02410 [Tenericutes bacterium]|nr:MAG: hypothetical protein DRP42_02410 [Mycoplasmatota bacterium]
MKNMRIVVSGTVGIGKTTTAKILEERLSLTNDDVFLNNEIIEGENPYLDSYYENRPE